MSSAKGSMTNAGPACDDAGAPAKRPIQTDSRRRPVTSVGFRSCATKERWSSHRNCMHQLRQKGKSIVRWHSEPSLAKNGSHMHTGLSLSLIDCGSVSQQKLAGAQTFPKCLLAAHKVRLQLNIHRKMAPLEQACAGSTRTLRSGTGAQAAPSGPNRAQGRACRQPPLGPASRSSKTM